MSVRFGANPIICTVVQSEADIDALMEATGPFTYSTGGLRNLRKLVADYLR